MRDSAFYVALLVILSSCGKSLEVAHDKAKSKKTRRHIAKKLDVSSDAGIDMIRQLEAKLTDIPLPVSCTPLPEYYNTTSERVVLGYRTPLSVDEAGSFYINEMERLGWWCGKQFSGYETLLSFEKPDRVCAVSIRPNRKKKADIIIFTGQKDLDCV